MKRDNISIENEAPVLQTEETASEKPPVKNKKKKIAILSVFLSMCLIGGLSWFLLYGLPENAKNPMMQGGKDKDVIGMYGSTQTFIHYPIDRDMDIMKEKEYLDLDRMIYFTKGAETIAITDELLESAPEDIAFFAKYFDLAIAGKYKEYNELFTDNYYKSNEPYYSFTQQMIYDIHIDLLGEDQVGDNYEYYYDVTYKIHRNNGTFRNDIGSDGSKTLFFTLVDNGDEILIDSITYYK